MAVVIETTIGDFTVDLYTEERPQTCKNFLKLCKMKYYNFCLFHSIQPNFLAQTGDPSGVGTGGESVFGLVYGENARYYEGEKMPKIKHTKPGLLSMVNCGNNMLGSQFFVTLGSELQSLDEHCIFAEITEGMDILLKLNETICDAQHRPYQDIRITHTVILHDPFEDLSGLVIPDASPEHSQQILDNGRIGADEEIDDTAGLSVIEVEEMKKEREAKARATILEIVGDLPDAEMAPPENVLFVCKLNPVTNDDDLEIIFSRFGIVKSCEVIRDQETGDSLQYAFVEFENKKACEEAYFKMDNVLIDDRRIHVDFSQSVAKMRWRGKGRGVDYFEMENRRENDKHRRSDDSRRGSKTDSNRNSDSRRRVEEKRERHERREESSDSVRHKREKEADRKSDSKRKRDTSNHEHSSRYYKNYREEKKEIKMDDSNRNRYLPKNEERRPRRIDDKQNYTTSVSSKDPVTGKIWGEPFRVVDRRNVQQKRDYDSSDPKVKDRLNRSEQSRSSEHFKQKSGSTERISYKERGERKSDRRDEKREADKGRNGLQKNGQPSNREIKAKDASPLHMSSPLSSSRSKIERSRDQTSSSPLAGSSKLDNSGMVDNTISLASPDTKDSDNFKVKKAKKGHKVEDKTMKVKKKKKKYSSSSNSDSSSSSESSDSESSSSDSDSSSPKRKVRTTIAKKYYHKGKLVKIIKKKKDSSTDSDTDDSSESDRRKKKHRKKARTKKIVKIIEKRRKRKHDSSDDSGSESSSSSEESDDSINHRKKRKLELKKNKKTADSKKKKKSKHASSTEEENEEEKNSQKSKKSSNS